MRMICMKMRWACIYVRNIAVNLCEEVLQSRGLRGEND